MRDPAAHPTTAIDAADLDVPRKPATLARFARPRSDAPTRIALLADPHVSTDKHGTWKLYHRTRARLRAALADCTARGVDGIAIAGDLTEDGRRADFEWVRDELAALEVPLLAVPGNHDVPKTFDAHETPTIDEFEAHYAPDGFPTVVRMGGVDLIGLNSASAPDGSLAESHDGLISADQLDRLDDVLSAAENPIVVAHHNLPGLGGADDAWLPHDPVRNADALLDVLARHDVPLHVSGHIHVPTVARADDVPESKALVSKPERQGRSVDVAGLVCPALCSFPQAYLLLDIDRAGTTVTYVPVASREETAEAYEHARTHSTRSEAVAEMVLGRLASLPLVDERAPGEIEAEAIAD